VSDKKAFEIEFEEYIRDVEPEKQEKASNWACAIGLQGVDKLTTSEYLYQTARRNIDGEISSREAENLIHSYYESRTERTELEDNTRQADIVAARIAQLLSEKSFSFSTEQLQAIHKRLFTGVIPGLKAGLFRSYNITKQEWVLDGDTVLYSGSDLIRQTLEYDLNAEKNFDYSKLSKEETVLHISQFTADIWQIHPFGEGNTRTTSVFIIKYLHSLGLRADNETFKDNSWYFRNALVRANYTNMEKGIYRDNKYLELFFRNLILGEKNQLRNRYCHIRYNDSSVHENNVGINVGVNVGVKPDSSESRLFSLIQSNNSITAETAAKALNLSKRQTERLFATLKQKGQIKRTGAAKNGKWELNN
jgi:Protein involved in cell division